MKEKNKGELDRHTLGAIIDGCKGEELGMNLY
jgi:hypothetical protein